MERQGRLELARQGGATHTLKMGVENAVEAVRDITGGWMLDVVFDVTGHPTTLSPCIQLARQLGRLVLLGDTPVPTQQPLGPGVVSNSVAILGIHGYMVPERATALTPWSVDRMSRVFFDYLLTERMDVSRLVTRRCSPLDAAEVYLGLLKDRTADVGIVFDWSRLG